MYAVVACSRCRAPWAADLRHARVACPRCGTAADLARRRRLWQGDRAADARAAAAQLASAMAQGIEVADAAAAEQALRDDRPVPRHDAPADAAAARARDVRNLSQRAEEVARWMSELCGGATYDELVAALGKAGLTPERAEAEVARMLSCDIVYEPRAGFYKAL